ncbi:MAG: hypothetical protein ABI632_02840 [Pseudolysinimonas sp.]
MTLRAGSSFAVFVVVAVAAVALLADFAIKGSWMDFTRWVGPVALIMWAAWLLLVRPSIRIESDRAVVINVGRVTEVPWGHIVDIRRRLQLVLELDDGRQVECWGSPFPTRRMVGRTAQTEQDDPSAAVLRSAWLSAIAAPAGVTASVVRRVDAAPLLIGAGAVLATALTLSWGGAA